MPHRTPLPVIATTAAAQHAERVLAVSRAFLAVTGLVAIYIDPSEPARTREVIYLVLLGYAVYSLAAWAYVHASSRLTPWHTRALYTIDVLWTSALTFVSEAPVSPFFLFFLFLVLSSAYRWGFRETFGTAVIMGAIYLIENALAVLGPWHTWFTSSEFDLYRLIIRVAYLLLTGVLMGYLAEQDKLARAELAATAAVARQSHLARGVSGVVSALARTLLATFPARCLTIVVKDHDSGRLTFWQAEQGDEVHGLLPRRTDLGADVEREWLFADPARTWYAVPASAGALACDAQCVVAGAWPLTKARAQLSPTVASRLTDHGLAVVNLAFEHEWSARIFLFGLRRRSLERHLHFLDALADHATPALTNAFLLRRLRARAGAAERARVARELHDGAIQSLFAIDMKLEAMRRAPDDPAALRDDIAGVQGLVRKEVVELRALMQALRPIEIEASEQLPDILAHVVERFRRESGIDAHFISAGDRIEIARSRAREMVRIAQEALVNVRKHSGATTALVRLVGTRTGCQLVVEDDGRGFPFEGRLTGKQLDHWHGAPAVIRERTRLAGAELAIESVPGLGTRLEITLPAGAHHA